MNIPNSFRRFTAIATLIGLATAPALAASRQDAADLVRRVVCCGERLDHPDPTKRAHILRTGEREVGGRTYDLSSFVYIDSPDGNQMILYLIDRRWHGGADFRAIFDGQRGVMDGNPDAELDVELTRKQVLDSAACAVMGHPPSYRGEATNASGSAKADYEQAIQETLCGQD